MLHFILNALSLSSRSARAMHRTRINLSWVTCSWLRQLLQWKRVIAHPRQTKVGTRFQPFLHPLRRRPLAFFLPVSERVAGFGGGEGEQPLRFSKREARISYRLPFEVGPPECLGALGCWTRLSSDCGAGTSRSRFQTGESALLSSFAALSRLKQRCLLAATFVGLSEQ